MNSTLTPTGTRAGTPSDAADDLTGPKGRRERRTRMQQAVERVISAGDATVAEAVELQRRRVAARISEAAEADERVRLRACAPWSIAGLRAADAVWLGKAAELEATRVERVAARGRLAELDDAVKWARWLVWQRRRARLDREAHLLAMAELDAMFGETQRWLAERRARAVAAVEAVEAEMRAAAEDARDRADVAQQALEALEGEHTTRREVQVAARVARLAELTPEQLVALRAEAGLLRDESAGKPDKPASQEAQARWERMRQVVVLVNSELALRAQADGDEGDGDGADGLDGQGVPVEPFPRPRGDGSGGVV